MIDTVKEIFKMFSGSMIKFSSSLKADFKVHKDTTSDFEKTKAFYEQLQPEIIAFENPAEEDLETAKKVAETVVWVDDNKPFFVSYSMTFKDAVMLKALSAAAFSATNTEVFNAQERYLSRYEDAALLWYKAVRKGDKYPQEEADKFVEFTKKCRELCQSKEIKLCPYPVYGWKPDYFDELPSDSKGHLPDLSQ